MTLMTLINDPELATALRGIGKINRLADEAALFETPTTDLERENERLQREVERLTLRCEQLEEELASGTDTFSNAIHFAAGQMVGRYNLRREQGDSEKVLAFLWELGQSIYGDLFTDNIN